MVMEWIEGGVVKGVDTGWKYGVGVVQRWESGVWGCR